MIDDDVLDVSDALGDWLRPTTIKTVTVTTVDFEEIKTVTARTQDCVIQVAQPAQLLKLQLDISVPAILIHSESPIEVGELVEFNGMDHKIITPSRWTGYGFIEVVARATNKPIETIT